MSLVREDRIWPFSCLSRFLYSTCPGSLAWLISSYKPAENIKGLISILGVSFFFATHSCLGGFGSPSPVAYMITSGNPIKCGTNQKTSPHALCNLTFLLTYCTTKLGAVAIRSSILYIAVPYISPIKKKIGDCHCIAAFPGSPKVLHYTTCCRFSIKRFSFVFFSAFSEMFLIVI